MKKILVSLMAVMLLVGFVPTTTVEASEVEPSEVENLREITDRNTINVSINQNSVNLRSGPGTNFASLGLVHRGDRAVFLRNYASSGGYWWYQIRMTSGQNAGRTGWVREDFLNWHL